MYRDRHTHARRTGRSVPVASRRRGVAAAVVATALWGVGGTVAGVLFQHGAAPMEVVTVRTWVALAGLLLVTAVRRPPRPAGVRPLLPVTGFGLAVAASNAALFLAIDQLPVAVALVLQNLAPAFVVGWLMVSARTVPRPAIVIGLLAALAGVALVVRLPTAGMSGGSALGVGLGLAAAAGVAAFSVLGGQAARATGALTANTGAFVVSGAVWLVWQLPHGIPALCRQPALLAGSVGIGVLGTFAPFLLYAWASARLGPQTTAVIISLEPLFGALAAWVWLGQTISVIQIIGGVVLLGAVVFLQSAGVVRGPRAAARPPVRSHSGPAAPVPHVPAPLPVRNRTCGPREGTGPLTTVRSDATGSSL
ncbi:DMT family transporter [Streptomyces polygonati]|uniref:DMT family transporter n=1 Tax=Streptomyces polygonati TaxID=1617087 RepID=A0ABV8HGH6_9ACTN